MDQRKLYELISLEATRCKKLMSDRHDEFMRIVANDLAWQQPGDVDIFRIRSEMEAAGVTGMSLEHISHTPDYFEIQSQHNVLKIYDIKVTTHVEASETKCVLKYTDAFRRFTQHINWDLQVTVISYNPKTRRTKHFRKLTDEEVQRIDFYHRDIETLMNTFKGSKLFMQLLAQSGDIKMTDEWDVDLVPDQNSEVWIDFVEHMDAVDPGFLELALNSNWMDKEGKRNWRDLESTLNVKFTDYIESQWPNTETETFQRASTENLKDAFEELEKKMMGDYENICSEDAKPSLHFVWSDSELEMPQSGGLSNDRKAAIMWSKIQDSNPKSVEGKYALNTLKGYHGVKGTLDDETAKLPNDQQPKVNEHGDVAVNRVCYDVNLLFKMRTHQNSGYKKRKNRPRLVDKEKSAHVFENEGILEQKRKIIVHPTGMANKDRAERSIKYLGSKLGKESKDKGEILTEFLMEEQYNNACEDGGEGFIELRNSCATRCAYDISDMFRNALATGKCIKRKCARMYFGRSTSTILITQNTRTESRNNDFVFIMIAFTKDGCDPIELDTVVEKIPVAGGVIHVSKAMRLDMGRIKLLVTGLSKWVIASEMVRVSRGVRVTRHPEMAAMLFCMCFSITKNMIFISDSMRYIMANIMADASDTCGYIKKSFDPVTKDMFTVHLYNCVKRTALRLNDQIQDAKLKDIRIEDDDITESGFETIRLNSIFGGPEINTFSAFEDEIRVAYYLCNKGLHGTVHNIMTLGKVPITFELEAREKYKKAGFIQDNSEFSITPVSIMYEYKEWLKHNRDEVSYMRVRAEEEIALKSKPFQIPTMTSSKTCMKRVYENENRNKGNLTAEITRLRRSYDDSQAKRLRMIEKAKDKLKKNTKANHMSEADLKVRESEIRRAESKHRETKKYIIENGFIRYKTDHRPVRESLSCSIEDFVKLENCKVFDRLYEMYKTGVIGPDDNMLQAVNKIARKNSFYFGMFCKNQRSAHDREIYKSTMELKMSLYVMEGIYKIMCDITPQEKITLGGDKKGIDFERVNREHFLQELDYRKQKLSTTTVKISADATKWSPRDNTEKFMYAEVMSPFLTRKEKLYRLALYCKYMEKRFVIPEQVIEELTWGVAGDYREGTKDLTTNNIKIRWNWLQGNMNYASSFFHVLAYNNAARMIRLRAQNKGWKCKISYGVHSDDSFALVTYGIEGQLPNTVSLCNEVVGCITSGYKNFAIELSTKKSYASTKKIEFVSIVMVHGKTVPNWIRSLLPIYADLPYTSFQNDISAGLGHIQAASRYGAPPSILLMSINLVQNTVYGIYSMKKGQVNDPCLRFDVDRECLPIALAGKVNTELRLLTIFGAKAHDVTLAVNVMKVGYAPSVNDIADRKELNRDIRNADRVLALLTICHPLSALVGNGVSELPEASMQYGLIKPKSHTKANLIKSWASTKDFLSLIGKGKDDQITRQDLLPIYEGILDQVPMLITTPRTAKQYQQWTVFRFCSRSYREQISVDDQTGMFIRQIINSRRPVVSKKFLTDFRNNSDFDMIDDMNEMSVNERIEYMTYSEAWEEVLKASILIENEVETNLETVSKIYMSNQMLKFVLNTRLQEKRTHSDDLVSSKLVPMKMEHAERLTVNPEKTVIARVLFPGTEEGKVTAQLNLDEDIAKASAFIKDNSRIEEIKGIIEQKLTIKTEPSRRWEVVSNYVSSLMKLAECAFTLLTYYKSRSTAYVVLRSARTTQSFLGMIRGRLMKDNLYVNFTIRRDINFAPTFSQSPAFKGDVPEPIERIITHIAYKAKSLFPEATNTQIAGMINSSVRAMTPEYNNLREFIRGTYQGKKTTAFRGICIIAVNLGIIGKGEHAYEWLRSGAYQETRPYWAIAHADRKKIRGAYEVTYSNEFGKIKMSGHDQWVSNSSMTVQMLDQTPLLNMRFSKILNKQIPNDFPEIRYHPKNTINGRHYLVLNTANRFRQSIMILKSRGGVQNVICELKVYHQTDFGITPVLTKSEKHLTEIIFKIQDVETKRESVRYQQIQRHEIPEMGMTISGFDVTRTFRAMANWTSKPTMRSNISWDLILDTIDNNWVADLIEDGFNKDTQVEISFDDIFEKDIEIENVEDLIDQQVVEESGNFMPDYEIELIDTRFKPGMITSIRKMAALAAYRVILGEGVFIPMDGVMESDEMEEKLDTLLGAMCLANYIAERLESQNKQGTYPGIHLKMINMAKMCAITIASFSKLIALSQEGGGVQAVQTSITKDMNKDKATRIDILDETHRDIEELLQCMNGRNMIDDACVYASGFRETIEILDQLGYVENKRKRRRRKK